MDARDSAMRDDVVAEDRISVADVLDASDASEPADVASSVSPANIAANARCGAVERSRRGGQRVRAKTTR